MCIPGDFLYTSEHVWVKIEGQRAKIGITKYAQSDIGEILLVELPEAGKQVKEGERLAVIETAKAISDLKAPVSGKVIEINQDLEERPELITREPYKNGWLVVLEIDPSEDLGRLMNFKQYEAYLEEEGAI